MEKEKKKKKKLKLSNLKLLDISMCLTGFHKNNTTPHANQNQGYKKQRHLQYF